MPLRYIFSYYTFNFTAMVTIYYTDGTVAISSGGIEMGQGMNTRVSRMFFYVISRSTHLYPILLSVYSWDFHYYTTGKVNYENLFLALLCFCCMIANIVYHKLQVNFDLKAINCLSIGCSVLFTIHAL